MFRALAATGLVAVTACSSSQSFDAAEPLHTVLLEYSAPPTSADSAALSSGSAGTVTMYPLMKAMTIVTRIPSGAFANLVPKPFEITDFAALDCPLEVDLTIAPTFGAADSTQLVATGVHFTIFRRLDEVALELTPATFALTNQFNGNPDILSGYLEGCSHITAFDRARTPESEQ
jgi:hypothetical protein